jgi:uncharacterized protein
MAYLMLTMLYLIDNTVINESRYLARDDAISMNGSNEVLSEERLMPLVRSHLADILLRQGLRVKEIADALNVTQPAVTQYLKGRRGRNTFTALNHVDEILNPLAEKLLRRIRSGGGGLEAVELLEAARQLAVMNRKGALKSVSDSTGGTPDKNRESIKLLRDRLQLELKAAEKYLELANRSTDEHTKLLLRLIASDSIRHGDIVSQIVSWLEITVGPEREFQAPDRELLEEMIALEDSAKEVNLRKSVKTGHPIARLLLEWIDTDEEKHEKIVTKMLCLGERV